MGSCRQLEGTFVAFSRLEATQEFQLHKCDIWDAPVSFPRRRLTERSWQVFVSFPRAGAHREILTDICVISAVRGSQRAPGRHLCRFRGRGLTESSWQIFALFSRAGARRQPLACTYVVCPPAAPLRSPTCLSRRFGGQGPTKESYVLFPPVWRTGSPGRFRGQTWGITSARSQRAPTSIFGIEF